VGWSGHAFFFLFLAYLPFSSFCLVERRSWPVAGCWAATSCSTNKSFMLSTIRSIMLSTIKSIKLSTIRSIKVSTIKSIKLYHQKHQAPSTCPVACATLLHWANACSAVSVCIPHRSPSRPQVRIRIIFSTALSLRINMAKLSVLASRGK